MGKETLFKKTVARVGLVPITIAALTFSAGCAPEASSPRPQTDISRNSAQFPGTNNDRPLQTLRETPKPIPTAAPTLKTSERKVFVSKKPDELFRTLLGTAIEQSSLPPGMRTLTYSAGILNAASQALKAVGQASIGISDGDPKFEGQANGSLSFTVFPDAESAKTAYNMIINSSEQKRNEEGFPYPTTSFGTEAVVGKIKITTTIMPAENVLIAAMLSDTNMSGAARYKQNETIALAKSGLEHLRKVGR